jgi:hypothetical protein
MSRAYRIRVCESVRRHVVVSDGVKTQLELLEVLPREAMLALLAKELERRGFICDGAKAHRSDDDGLEIVVDLTDGSVTVTSSKREQIVTEVKKEGTADREGSSLAKEARAKLSEKALEEAERIADVKERAARSANTARLEAKLNDLQKELDDIATRVTGEALKIRASQLGEIEEMNEDPNTGALTIRVRT